MTIRRLEPEQLRLNCDPGRFTFKTTADLEPVDSIIGQPRAVRALEFGLNIRSQGYNIFVIGETGSELTTTIERFLKRQASRMATPDDLVYVHNFKVTHQPHIISLPAGLGQQLRDDMHELVSALKKDLTEVFDSDSFRADTENIRQSYKEGRDVILEEIRLQSGREGMTTISTPSGLQIMPLIDGRAMTAEELRQLPVDEYAAWEKKRQVWDERLEEVYRKMRELDIDTREQMENLGREVAENTISHYFERLHASYEEHEAVRRYFDQVFEDVLENLSDFFPPEGEEEKEERGPDLRRYEVNLVVDNAALKGAPVVTELNPRYSNLIGRIEYEAQHTTHFTNIKGGSLHRANGGFLLLNVRDLMGHRNAWEALKRALKAREIQLQPNDRTDGNQVLAKSLDPEPVPLNIKVVLLGGSNDYHRLYRVEEGFNRLFKVKVQFDWKMTRSPDNETAYAQFVATLCHQEKLSHFNPAAVAEVVNYGARLADNQLYLSTRFELIADLVREASFWSHSEGHPVVEACDVTRALQEWTERANLSEIHAQESIQEGFVFISTTGRVVGQVNGLSVIDDGDYSYGRPSRITARAFQGERSIINIDREVELTGSLHDKGLLILIGYLGGTYAQQRPLSVSASLTFEQAYSGIDGDSASAAELFALLTSLSGLPIKQHIGVTGSVNQMGEIQAIGGVNEKIEGFFKICRLQGLTGEQGAIIPAANIPELMLKEEVVEAVRQGQFTIWGIDTIEEGMALLTDAAVLPADEDGEFPEDSLHALVLEGLARLDKDDDKDDEKEDDGGEESGSPTGS